MFGIVCVLLTFAEMSELYVSCVDVFGILETPAPCTLH